MTSNAATQPNWRTPGSNDNVVSRMERIPFAKWQVNVRLLVGVGTFFDAFDALAIAQVLPVLIKDWNLTPGQIAWLIAIGYLGQLFGALLFSALAERKGRLIGLSASIVTFAVFGIGCALAPSYTVFMIFRFLQGLGLGGEVPIGAVYINEITKAKGRGRFVLLFELVFSVGVVVAALIGRWVVPHLGWHYMYVIGCLPIVIVPLILTRLPESPRWLASQGKTAEADRAMSMIEEKVAACIHEPMPEPEPVVHKTVEKKGSVKELLSPAYRARTLSVWAIWVATYVVYYGIGTWLPSLYSKFFNLPLETSLTYAMIGNACAFIGAAACAFLIDVIGRRRIFIIALSGSALMLAILAITGAHHPGDVALWGSLAWLFAGASSIGLYLYTPEIYPTRVRAVGVGTATAWMRGASMAGPLIIGALVGYGLPVVFVVFAVIAVLGAFVVWKWAVETSQRVLEEVSP